MKQSNCIHWQALALAAMFVTATTVAAQPLGGDNCDVPETTSSAQTEHIPVTVVAEAVEGDNCDAPMRFLSPYLAAMALTSQPAETLGGDNCDAPERYLSRDGYATTRHVAAGSPTAN